MDEPEYARVVCRVNYGLARNLGDLCPDEALTRRAMSAPIGDNGSTSRVPRRSWPPTSRRPNYGLDTTVANTERMVRVVQDFDALAAMADGPPR
jgi:hypothetical protein